MSWLSTVNFSLPTDDNQVGLVTSLLLLGAFFSCPVAGIVADKYGRRATILGGALVFMLGGALQTGAQSIDMMMAGRVRPIWPSTPSIDADFFLTSSLPAGVSDGCRCSRLCINLKLVLSTLFCLARLTLSSQQIAQSSIRGRLTTLQQFFLGIGEPAADASCQVYI